MEDIRCLKIPISTNDKVIVLTLFAEVPGITLLERSDALQHGESPYQIKEGCAYEYSLQAGYKLAPSEIVSRSKVNPSCGRILPNIYVGTLTIDVLDSNDVKQAELKLEVQSVKTEYRTHYRIMLNDIAEKSSSLLFHHSSFAAQNFEIDSLSSGSTIYQRFAFIKAILATDEFQASIHKILSAPVTAWEHSEKDLDVRRVKRFGRGSIKQIINGSYRLNVPEESSIYQTVKTIPSRISVKHTDETIDTPENRFIKYALTVFQTVCDEFKNRLEGGRVQLEANLLLQQFGELLSHSVFKEVSPLTSLPFNSPVLQRKEGYREVFRTWLLFDLASKLAWHGGEDVYSGNKRDVAVLYEYWVFFKLLDLIKEIFNIDPIALENLFETSENGLGLKLKQGRYVPLHGVYHSENRTLQIEFSYNKTFKGNSKYPDGGSWSRDLRPDYTLSIWPFGKDQQQAEKEELIVHIHFDAKYKVDNLQAILGNIESIEEENSEQKRGTYKRADLLKMHAYRDAIRRTSGAYVLYPGEKSDYKKGFHELIPGLGAFAISPSVSNDGTEELRRFLKDLVEHFTDKSSQREKMALRTFETYMIASEYLNTRPSIPDQTFVLVGYYRPEQWDWIIKSGLYNTRAGSERGALRLDTKVAGAKYILLHTSGETVTSKLLKIVSEGPKVLSKADLIDNGYPTEPSQDFYLGYEVEVTNEEEFFDKRWDVTMLEGHRKGRGSALPFTTSLKELEKAQVV